MATIEASVRPDASSGIVSPFKLAHFVLKTSRFPVLVAWYKLVLNATAAFENDGIAFLAYDDEHHRIAFLNMPRLDEQVQTTAGVHHIAFTYATLDVLLDNYARLKNVGILPEWSVNHGPTTSLYYRDPDGNRLEFQVDNYETVEAAGEFFFTEAFAINPIGVDFDPEDLRRRLLAGEDEESLKQRPPSGPRGIGDVPQS